MQQRIMFVIICLIGGIYSLHTHIETHDEIAKVETEAHPVVSSQFTEEAIKCKLSAWLVWIVT
jgi:hypothetical protein